MTRATITRAMTDITSIPRIVDGDRKMGIRSLAPRLATLEIQI